MIEPREAASGRRVWGVAGLLAALSESLSSRFSAVTVSGELSGFTRAASGHCYFSLKDADGLAASLRGAMFRRAAGLLDFEPGDGMRVEMRGRLAVYEPRGELQFVAEAMRLAGAGSLYEQFLRLRERLEAAGLFARERKRPLPSFPTRIGIVTSLGAAALHDVLTALARRAPQVSVVVYPSLVQGSEAPRALVSALELANARQEVDLLLLVRGGGSLEDLWAFNDERVVRAVAGSALPIVCGVGHETDITLADLAADLRAPTPTAAAELAAPARADCLERLSALGRLLSLRTTARLDGQAQRLDRLALKLSRPSELVNRQRRLLALLAQRTRTAPLRRVSWRDSVWHAWPNGIGKPWRACCSGTRRGSIPWRPDSACWTRSMCSPEAMPGCKTRPASPSPAWRACRSAKTSRPGWRTARPSCRSSRPASATAFGRGVDSRLPTIFVDPGQRRPLCFPNHFPH